MEITKDAKSVVDHPFEGDTVFIMGNEVRDKIQVSVLFSNSIVVIFQTITKSPSLYFTLKYIYSYSFPKLKK